MCECVCVCVCVRAFPPSAKPTATMRKTATPWAPADSIDTGSLCSDFQPHARGYAVAGSAPRRVGAVVGTFAEPQVRPSTPKNRAWRLLVCLPYPRVTDPSYRQTSCRQRRRCGVATSTSSRFVTNTRTRCRGLWLSRVRWRRRPSRSPCCETTARVAAGVALSGRAPLSVATHARVCVRGGVTDGCVFMLVCVCVYVCVATPGMPSPDVVQSKGVRRAACEAVCGRPWSRQRCGTARSWVRCGAGRRHCAQWLYGGAASCQQWRRLPARSHDAPAVLHHWRRNGNDASKRPQQRRAKTMARRRINTHGWRTGQEPVVQLRFPAYCSALGSKLQLEVGSRGPSSR